MAVALVLFLTLPKASHAQRATLDRYPSDAVHHVVRDVAVTYSADDVGAFIRFGGQKDQNGLGYPDKNLFELHNRFPKLQMTMVAVTENRYLGGANILNDIPGMEVWRRICDRGPSLEWMDMGFHGRFHAPPTDSNVDHHEFDPVQPGDHDESWDHRIALTPAYNEEIVALWRDTVRAIGCTDASIVTGRFPGYRYSLATLQAMYDQGFISYLGYPGDANGNADVLAAPGIAGRTNGADRVIELPSGAKMIYIPSLGTTNFNSTLTEQALASGVLNAATFRAYGDYQAKLTNFKVTVDRLIANEAGLIDIMNHWFFMTDLFGAEQVQPRLEMLIDLLEHIDDRYGDRVWWATANEISKYLDARHHAQTTEIERTGCLGLDVNAPDRWTIWGWSTVLSYSVELPTTASPVTRVAWSDGAAAFQPLDASAWWEEDGVLHVTVPLRAHTRLALSRGSCDLNANGTPDVFDTTPPPGVPVPMFPFE